MTETTRVQAMRSTILSTALSCGLIFPLFLLLLMTSEAQACRQLNVYGSFPGDSAKGGRVARGPTPEHLGSAVDMTVGPWMTPICSTVSGTVVSAINIDDGTIMGSRTAPKYSLGGQVVVKAGDGNYYQFGHCSAAPGITIGSQVQAGQYICDQVSQLLDRNGNSAQSNDTVHWPMTQGNTHIHYAVLNGVDPKCKIVPESYFLANNFAWDDWDGAYLPIPLPWVNHAGETLASLRGINNSNYLLDFDLSSEQVLVFNPGDCQGQVSPPIDVPPDPGGGDGIRPDETTPQENDDDLLVEVCDDYKPTTGGFLQNGSFASGTCYWQLYVDNERIYRYDTRKRAQYMPANKVGASYEAEVIMKEGGGTLRFLQGPIKLPGGTMRLIISLKTVFSRHIGNNQINEVLPTNTNSQPNTATVTLEVRNGGPDGAVMNNVPMFVDMSHGKWEKLRFDFDASGSDNAWFIISMDNAPRGNLYVDDVSLEAISGEKRRNRRGPVGQDPDVNQGRPPITKQ